MMLTGNEIKKRLGKDIIITPFEEDQLNPNSYNLRLHDRMLVYNNHILDFKKPNETSTITIPEDGLILFPGNLYLARTMEYTETYNLVPIINGRSSVGRLGLFIHISAGLGDTGFCGYWTLELSCIQPVKIYPFIPICQLYYNTVEGEVSSYSGRYQNNNGVQPSLFYKGNEK